MQMIWDMRYFEYVLPLEDWESLTFRMLESGENRLVARIRHQLKERSKEDIERMALVIDSMMLDEQKFDLITEMLAKDGWRGLASKVLQDESLFDRYGMVTLRLMALKETYGLTSIKDYIAMGWSEVFALCALNLLGAGIEYLHHASDESEPASSGSLSEDEMSEIRRIYGPTAGPEPDVSNLQAGWHLLTGSTFHLLTALELLSVSEVLRAEEAAGTPEDSASGRPRKSLQKVLAGKKRQQPMQQIKDRFGPWYIKFGGTKVFPTKAAAARQYYEELSDQDKRLFISPSAAERTLLKALREFINDTAEL